MKLILIEWVDSHGPVDGWNVIEDKQNSEPLICESVGWLIYNGKNCKTIVPHKAGHKNNKIALQGRGELTIPTRAIIKLKEINV